MTFAELRVAVKLVFAHARQRPARVVLASLSTMAAACVVVWVVSGYDAMIGEFGSMGEEYVGRYELLLLPRRGGGDGDVPLPPMGFGGRAVQISQELLASLRNDSEVALVEPVFETTLKARKVGEAAETKSKGFTKDKKEPAASKKKDAAEETGPIIMGGMAQAKKLSRVPTVVGTDSAEPLHTLLRGKWIDRTNAKEPQGAITAEAAEQLGVDVGDEVAVGSTKIRIVAVVEQPKRLPGPKFMVGLPPTKPNALPGGPVTNALYVTTALAEKLSSSTARASYAGVVLKSGVKVDDFIARWSDRFVKTSPAVEVRTPGTVDREVASSTTLSTVRSQAYSATAISLLAALFIIFTTLSMGVDERIRQFAMLRAVAFTKGQIATMITLESLMLGLIGWGGGLLAGWGLLQLAGQWKPELLAEGGSLGAWCVLLSGACALGGSLAASIMPAWKAMSVSPLDAMVPKQAAYSGAPSWILTIAGLLLIAVNPLVIFYVPMNDSSRYLASAALGCTSMVIGFVLLAPFAVVLTERILGPVLAFCLRSNSRLLATQLSANMWRSVGTTVALTIGLGLFVTMQTWGYSMLAPFTPGEWAPDLLVSIGAGVPDSSIPALQEVPGLAKGMFLPLSFKQVKFAEDVTGFKERPSATRQDNCVMIGFDPDAALGGDSPLFNFEFAEGNRKEAIMKLKQGRYCLVPDHFARESGLGLGQSFRVNRSSQEDEPVEYQIAGVVSMPGWHWLSKTGFRRARAAGLMFASFDRVKTDFNTGRVSMFWGNMDGSSSEAEIKTAIQEIVNRSPKGNAAPGKGASKFGRPGGPPGGKGIGPKGASVTMRTTESVRAEIRGRADKIIWALSELPLITLLVTSLGVMNTIQASIRARRWDMGVLRSLGVTRFELIRLILGEAILIGAVACVLSLAFGAMAGYCGTGVTRYVDIRGGMVTPLVIPWAKLSIGFGLSLGLCLLAALWPAIRTGWTEPLRLLQSGRAAT